MIVTKLVPVAHYDNIHGFDLSWVHPYAEVGNVDDQDCAMVVNMGAALFLHCDTGAWYYYKAGAVCSLTDINKALASVPFEPDIEFDMDMDSPDDHIHALFLATGEWELK